MPTTMKLTEIESLAKQGITFSIDPDTKKLAEQTLKLCQLVRLLEGYMNLHEWKDVRGKVESIGIEIDEECT